MKTSNANINSCIGMDGLLKQLRHEEFSFRSQEEKNYDRIIGLIQYFYQLISQNQKV